MNLWNISGMSLRTLNQTPSCTADMNPWSDFICELMEMAWKAGIAAGFVLLVALMLVGHLLSSGPEDDED